MAASLCALPAQADPPDHASDKAHEARTKDKPGGLKKAQKEAQKQAQEVEKTVSRASREAERAVAAAARAARLEAKAATEASKEAAHEAAEAAREAAHEALAATQQAVEDMQAKVEAAGKKARTEARAAGKDAKAQAQAARQAMQEAMREAKERAREARESLRERLRAARWEVLREKLGNPTSNAAEQRKGEPPAGGESAKAVPPAVTQELRRHAMFMARLTRARELAVEADDEKSVARADALIEKESERHARKLAQAMKSKGRAAPGSEQPAEEEETP